eukprot:SAG31_NODE_3475_length_4230_cov_3.659162_4_plen_29_part_01
MLVEAMFLCGRTHVEDSVKEVKTQPDQPQ